MMTHTPHTVTVSLNYTKQPGKICRSKKREKKCADSDLWCSYICHSVDFQAKMILLPLNMFKIKIYIQDSGMFAPCH